MRRALRPDLLDSLVELVRADPTIRLAAAGERLGVGPRVIRRLMPQAEAVLRKEKDDARAVRAATILDKLGSEPERAELIRLDLATEHAVDATLLRNGKDAIADAIDTARRLARHGGVLCERIEKADNSKMKPGEAMSLLSRSALFVKSITESTDRLVRLGQLLLGQPDAIVAVQDTVSPEEVKAQVEALNRELQLMEGKDAAAIDSDLH